MIKYFRVALSAMMFFFLLASCNPRQPDVVEVDFTRDLQDSEPSDAETRQVLRIAIAPVISPRESYSYYQELFEYMGKHLEVKVEFRQRSSYEEVNEMLERNLIDLAFICTGAYIDGSEGMELLAGPQFNGLPLYQALVIVSARSDIRTFADFRGRDFAYTDPLSFTGRIYPEKRINDLGENPETFFRSVQYTNGHDVSMQMVARNLVDGASVNGLIYSYVRSSNPDITNNLRIIEHSEFFGVPPIVTSLLLPRETRDRIKDLFLEMHQDPQGRIILDHLIIERFVAMDDSMYNSAREIRKQAWQ
jgi:phosphonate transport system substrate-binding protein